MNRLLLLLMLVSQPVWAGWVLLGETRDTGTTTLYFDPATIRKTAEGRRVWTMYSSEQVLTDLGAAYRSARWLSEFDCIGERKRALQWESFYQPMLRGSSVSRWTDGPGPWEYIAPNTVGEVEFKAICRVPVR